MALLTFRLIHLFSFLLIASPCLAKESVEKKEYHKVLRVVDGDTIEVKTPSGAEKIRVIGEVL